MRVLIVLATLVLAGCAEYPQEWPAPIEEDPAPSSNATVEAVQVAREDRGVATTPYTAPVAIELARHEGEDIVLVLTAGPQGLQCIAQPRHDPATPAGYKPVSSWTRCSLSANGTTFASGEADGLVATLDMIPEVPVEKFAWNMSVGQIMANNTGQHEFTLETVGKDISAAPEIFHRHWSHDGPLHGGHHACDVPWQDGIATLRFEAHAHNGRAVLDINATDYEVVDVKSAHPASSPENHSLGAGWWETNGHFVAVGEWAHESQAALELTISFRGAGDALGLLPPLGCTGALFVDHQEIGVEARALGIAAGWTDLARDHVEIAVWHL